ncbi:MAG: ABC transporter ATP-binding protein, partial [Actinomycetia bacterium]|nr:ABC transporter ATP-binding protein [Actinomycetes bacterium]
MTVAIQVENVSKRFTKHSEPARTLKERLLTWHSSTTELFNALHQIDFTVDVGETFGILGHNGSGKSTLLKCIAGTVQPSEGVIRVRGQLSALLELGAGFHPDLTGRENIYLNGSILGFSKVRIEAIFDEIVEFSGLEEFV